MLENLYRVMRNYSEILDGGGARRDHAMTDAGVVHLDAEKIRRLVFTRELHQGIAVAEADLHYDRRAAGEDLIKIQKLWRKLNTVIWPKLVKRSLL